MSDLRERAARQAYYRVNRERFANNRSEVRAANIEQALAAEAEYRAANRERIRAYDRARWANVTPEARERKNALCRAWVRRKAEADAQ